VSLLSSSLPGFLIKMPAPPNHYLRLSDFGFRILHFIDPPGSAPGVPGLPPGLLEKIPNV
jgi:hypothetical protein